MTRMTTPSPTSKLVWLALSSIASLATGAILADRTMVLDRLLGDKAQAQSPAVVAKLDKLTDELQKHEALIGHPGTVALLQRMEQDISEVKSDVKALLKRR